MDQDRSLAAITMLIQYAVEHGITSLAIQQGVIAKKDETNPVGTTKKGHRRFLTQVAYQKYNVPIGKWIDERVKVLSYDHTMIDQLAAMNVQGGQHVLVAGTFTNFFDSAVIDPLHVVNMSTGVVASLLPEYVAGDGEAAPGEAPVEPAQAEEVAEATAPPATSKRTAA